MQEAYWCLLAHYAAGLKLDDRVLLHGGFGGIVGYLRQRGLDRPDAVLPGLSGVRAADWLTFRRAYAAVARELPGDAQTQDGFAAAAISGMAESLHDDHTAYTPAGRPPPGAPQPDLGMSVRLPETVPGAEPTAVVVSVQPDGPAAEQGLRPGDVITALNGGPVLVQPPQEATSPALDSAARLWTPAALGWLQGMSQVLLTVIRPEAGTRSLTLQPRALPLPKVTYGRLSGDVAYIRIEGFPTGTGKEVLADLRGLENRGQLHGVIIDIRGNSGGDPSGVVSIVSAFVHDRTVYTTVDGSGHRRAVHTDDRVPLIHQPLVVLIDGGSVSAADLMAAAVRDLHLGTLVGERSAGLAAGAGRPFRLDDGSHLSVDTAFILGPKGEVIDGIGVPVDQAAPLPTAADLSRSSDPGIAAALQALAHR